MKWTHIAAQCQKAQLDEVCAIFSMVDPGLEIEDYSDIEENLMTVYGELIDDKILNSDRSKTKVAIYLSEEKDASGAMDYIAAQLKKNKLDDVLLTSETVDEQDWADNWKQFYKPLRIGRHLVVLPPWENFDAQKDDLVILMDPGMAFGTGTHETTKLCLTLLEKHLKKGERVLDVGTGSGILGIAALKLGAQSVHAYDIDPTAVRVARENFEKNGVADRAVCGVSDLLNGVDRTCAPYGFVTANIVADILIRMAPEIASFMANGARLVASGVIAGRRDDVVDAMTRGNLRLIDEQSDADWTALVFIK